MSLCVMGCSDDDDAETCGGTPTVSITSPTDSALVTPDDTFTLQIDNFEVVDFTENVEATPCEGHMHIFIREPGDPSPGTYINPPVQATEFTLGELFARDQANGEVPSGPRIVRVQLHNNDHTIVEDANHAEITVNLLVE